MLKNIFLRKYFFDFFLRQIKEMYYNENMTGRDRKNLRRFINRMVKNFEKIYQNFQDGTVFASRKSYPQPKC